MDNPFRVRALSTEKNNHFFGYYDVNPYSADGNKHLALETDFQNRRPVWGDTANVGYIDTASGKFIRVTETRGFNFQQGSMMNWLNIGGEELFCFNDIRMGECVSVITDIHGNERRVLPGAVSGMAENKPIAASLNYPRNFLCRAVVGYDTGKTGRPEKRIDENDGLYVMNVETGERKLIVTMDRLAAQLPMDEIKKGWMWFDHTTFNPSGTRILFFVRIAREDGRGWYSSLWTVGTDGSDLKNQLDYTHYISHYDWFDDETILISAGSDILKTGFYLFHDGKNDLAPFHHDVMPRDGHACFSPNREWVICDTYPDDESSSATLFLMRMKDGKKFPIGSYFADPLYRGDIRCDLHPRWNQDGSKFTFDSVHGEFRQIYEGEL